MSRVIAIGLGLSLNALLARLLTLEEMGAYFLAISIITLSVSLGQLGLPQVVVRFVAESMSIGMSGRAKQTVQKAIFLSLLGGAVVALMLYCWIGDLFAISLFHSEGIRSIIALISLSILIISVQGVVTETYRGFHDIRSASLVGSVLTPIISVLILSLLWISLEHSNLKQIFVITVVSSAVALVISGVVLIRRISREQGCGSVIYRELLSAGWPLCLVQIMIFIATQADLWIVGTFLVHRDAAIYGAVQKLLLLMTMTHSLIVAVAQSSVAELYVKGEKQKLQCMLQGMAFAACVPSGMLLLFFAFFGGETLRLVFGEFYYAGGSLLLVLSIGQYISMLLGPADMLLAMTGFQKQLMLVFVLMSMVRILLAIFLIRQYGLMGVALGWSIGAVIQSYLIWRMGIKYVGVKSNANFSAVVDVFHFRGRCK